MYKAFKWIMDRLLAFVALLILSPLFLFLIIAVVIDSKGGPFIVQKRDGYKKKTIKVIKFRSMYSSDFAFDVDHAVIDSNDAKVTRVGRFLRRFKLDELAQLINILKGDMSFVGPRPLLPAYIDRYERWEFQKFAVKPGLTGIPQIKGNGYLTVKSRSYYDALYTEKISLWTDFKIILLTIGVIFRGEEAFKQEASEEEIEKMKRRYQSPDGMVTVGEVLSPSAEKDETDRLLSLDTERVEFHLFVANGSTAAAPLKERGMVVHEIPDISDKKKKALRAFRAVLADMKFDVVLCADRKCFPFLRTARETNADVRIAVIPDGETKSRFLKYATMTVTPKDALWEDLRTGAYYRSLGGSRKKENEE